MTQVINHRMPIRPGVIVEIQLPDDLTRAEADWLKGFVRQVQELQGSPALMPRPALVELPPPLPGTSGTLDGLEAFLGRAQRAGQLSSIRATELRTATRRMLETFPDLARTPVAAVNIDIVVEAFRRVRWDDYAENTINQYAERFRSAVRKYRTWLD